VVTNSEETCAYQLTKASEIFSRRRGDCERFDLIRNLIFSWNPTDGEIDRLTVRHETVVNYGGRAR
jgi:hypothetical protein